MPTQQCIVPHPFTPSFASSDSWHRQALYEARRLGPLRQMMYGIDGQALYTATDFNDAPVEHANINDAPDPDEDVQPDIGDFTPTLQPTHAQQIYNGRPMTRDNAQQMAYDAQIHGVNQLQGLEDQANEDDEDITAAMQHAFTSAQFTCAIGRWNAAADAVEVPDPVRRPSPDNLGTPDGYGPRRSSSREHFDWWVPMSFELLGFIDYMQRLKASTRAMYTFHRRAAAAGLDVPDVESHDLQTYRSYPLESFGLEPTEACFVNVIDYPIDTAMQTSSPATLLEEYAFYY